MLRGDLGGELERETFGEEREHLSSFRGHQRNPIEDLDRNYYVITQPYREVVSELNQKSHRGLGENKERSRGVCEKPI